MQMLLELTSEYVRFLSTDSLKTRKQNMTAMNSLLEEVMGHEVGKQEVREIYTAIFKRQLELIVTANLKKPELLKQALEQEMAASGQRDVYEAIVLGINSDDLDIWAREVITERANVVKVEMELKKQKKGKGFFGRVFGSKEEQKSAAEQQE